MIIAMTLTMSSFFGVRGGGEGGRLASQNFLIRAKEQFFGGSLPCHSQ